MSYFLSKRIYTLFLVVIVSQLCVACGYISPFRNDEERSTRNRAFEQRVALPPPQNAAPILSQSMLNDGTVTIPEKPAGLNLRGLEGTLGLNSDQLFDFRVRDTETRFLRLEREVQRLHNEIKDMIPVLSRQMNLQDEIAEIVTVLRAQVKDGVKPNPNAVSEVQSEPKIGLHQKVADPPSSEPTLVNIRVADYPDKIRVVFESNFDLAFQIDFDAENQILILSSNKGTFVKDLENLQLRKKSLYAKHLSFTSSNKNRFEAIVAFNKIDRLEEYFVIPPNEDSTFYRTVVDLSVVCDC
jgi:hypothetical protein